MEEGLNAHNALHHPQMSKIKEKKKNNDDTNRLNTQKIFILYPSTYEGILGPLGETKNIYKKV
jgi:hypothetical protein